MLTQAEKLSILALINDLFMRVDEMYMEEHAIKEYYRERNQIFRD